MVVSSILEFLRQVDVEVGLMIVVVEIGVYCDRESVGESYWEWEGYVEWDGDGDGYVEWLAGGCIEWLAGRCCEWDGDGYVEWLTIVYLDWNLR